MKNKFVQKIYDFQKFILTGTSLFILLSLLFLFSACSPVTIQSELPSETIQASNNLPQKDNLTPTIPESTPSETINAYPIPPLSKNQETQLDPAYPVPTMEIIEEKDIFTNEPFAGINLDEPKRILWSDQADSFMLIGYQSLTYYAFPSLEILYQFTPTNEEVFLDAAPDGVHYAVSSDMLTIQIINWQTGSRTSFKLEEGFLAAQFSPNSKQILFSLMDQMAAILVNIDDGSVDKKLTGFETAAPVYNVGFVKDGEHLLWHARATLQISEIEQNRMGQVFNHEDFIAGYATNSTASIIATCAAAMENDEFSPYIFFWNVTTGELIQKIKLVQPSYSFAFSPDDYWFAYQQLGNILIIDMDTFTTIKEFPAHHESISQLVFSPDGRFLSSIGSENFIKFWEINE